MRKKRRVKKTASNRKQSISLNDLEYLRKQTEETVIKFLTKTIDDTIDSICVGGEVGRRQGNE